MTKVPGLPAALFALAAFVAAPASFAQTTKIPVRVVVVTTFEIEQNGVDEGGEFQAWTNEYPLPVHLPFPAGYHELRYNANDQVLGIVTGEATARASASITALGHDPRFDLSHAYWVVAAIAGVDPDAASVGSTSWAKYVVDGGLAYEIDAREIPSKFPTGYIPPGRYLPYQQPVPPANSMSGQSAYTLDQSLVDWAYRLTKSIKLPDDSTLQAVRAPYTETNAKRPPFVLEGADLATDTFWIGNLFNTWAENWVSYWTKDKGTFTMSIEEDSGILQAIKFLGKGGLADPSRVLILRSASDYTVQPPDQTPAQFLRSEQSGGLSGFTESLSDAFIVASPIVRELSENWSKYESDVP